MWSRQTLPCLFPPDLSGKFIDKTRGIFSTFPSQVWWGRDVVLALPLSVCCCVYCCTLGKPCQVKSMSMSRLGRNVYIYHQLNGAEGQAKECNHISARYWGGLCTPGTCILLPNQRPFDTQCRCGQLWASGQESIAGDDSMPGLAVGLGSLVGKRLAREPLRPRSCICSYMHSQKVVAARWSGCRIGSMQHAGRVSLFPVQRSRTDRTSCEVTYVIGGSIGGILVRCVV